MNFFLRQGQRETEIFKKSKVAIIGLGGLGSNAALMLAKSGFRSLFLYDFDVVSESNLHRQFFSIDDLGEKKCHALKKHLDHFAHGGSYYSMDMKVEEKDLNDFFKYDLVIEGVDKAETKAMILNYALENDDFPPLVCASGIAGLDLTPLETKYVGKVAVCGDLVTSSEDNNLYYPKVMAVSALEVATAMDILIKSKER